MDISSFLGGNFLRHLDLPASSVVWTIVGASQQQLGSDQKICVQFQQHPKLLPLNQTNLGTLSGYGKNTNDWIGRPLELYGDSTFFQGKPIPCIRVRIPNPGCAPPVNQPQGYQPPPQPAGGAATVHQQPPPGGASGSPSAPPWGSL